MPATPPITYPDIQITEGDELVTYSKEGLKVKRQFTVDFADNAIPSKTLYTIMQSGSEAPGAMDLPVRGAPHPTITIPSDWATFMFLDTGANVTALCADVVTVKGLTSTQANIEVEYAILNAMTQEPHLNGVETDLSPALLTMASSVAATPIATDIVGNPLAIPYQASEGVAGHFKLTVIPGQQPIPFTASLYDFGSGGGFVPGTPNIKVTATAQRPATLFRFQRREAQPQNPQQWVGLINSSNWVINGVTYDPYVLLCTRIENETMDNGITYVVTYEFQLALESPTPKSCPLSGSGETAEAAQFVPIGTPASQESKPGFVSSWMMGAYYVLPSGYGLDTSTPANQVQPGQAPPDSQPFIFQIYGSVDFNAVLELTPLP